jgi:hypothetical protein
MAMSFVSVARADEPDLSTPKKAGVAFAKAVTAGDMAAVKELATGTDAEFALVKSMSDMVVSFKKLEDAAVKKFGVEAKLPQGMAMDLVGDIETAEEKIDGDKATLTIKSKPDDKNPPTFKKDGDKWKVDLSSLSKDPQSAAMAPLVPAMVKVLDTVTKNITEEKYKTAVELYTDMGQQLSVALTPPTEPAAK